MTVPALRVEGFWPRLRAALGLLLASGRAGVLGAAGTLAAGLALNWIFVLWTFRLAGSADGSLLLRATGQGVITLLFGILAPIGYLVLAKQVGGQAAARRLYGHHREEIVQWVVSNAARESAAAAEPKASVAKEAGSGDNSSGSSERMVRSLSRRLAAAPRPVAAVVRLLLRRSPFAALLPSLGTLTPTLGSAGGSLPAAVVVQIDAVVAGALTTARRTFRRVIAVNAIVIGILVLSFSLR